jgi:hypothetical protein
MLTNSKSEDAFISRLPKEVPAADAENALEFWGQQKGEAARRSDFRRPEGN